MEICIDLSVQLLYEEIIMTEEMSEEIFHPILIWTRILVNKTKLSMQKNLDGTDSWKMRQAANVIETLFILILALAPDSALFIFIYLLVRFLSHLNYFFYKYFQERNIHNTTSFSSFPHNKPVRWVRLRKGDSPNDSQPAFMPEVGLESPGS